MLDEKKKKILKQETVFSLTFVFIFVDIKKMWDEKKDGIPH